MTESKIGRKTGLTLFILFLLTSLMLVGLSSVQAYTNEEHNFSIDQPSGVCASSLILIQNRRE